MSEGLQIQGPGVLLRYPESDDAATLFELGSDPETTRFFSWGPYRELGQAERFIAGCAGQRERGEELGFVVLRDDVVTGWILLNEPRPRDRGVTAGAWLGRQYWGSGIHVEMYSLLMSLAFRRMGVERMGIVAAVDNERSRAAQAKLGFVPEGILRRYHLHGSEWHDLAVSSMLREEFETNPISQVPFRIEGEPPANWVFGD